MTKELPKAYEPKQYEDELYKRWEESGFFNPDNLEGEPYSIMMPPPNVTGVLHLGHALENSLMDVMARFQRMQGKKALLLPGTDHAAVATQARVEKNLVAQGIVNPREYFGREGLLEKIREYAESSKSTILSQIKKMGTSCDWSRLAYTFDDDRSKAVNTVFKKMYDDGLIYRGYRVVNWSVKGQSTCSDDELVYIDRKAKLYTFKYSENFPFTIATTRPETKLGDTAVAVNPDDPRYQKYIGQIFDVNFCGVDLKLKIIADEHVEIEFGTGALGVTPAHSSVDFDMYERKKAQDDEINLIQVIGEDGKMTVQAGKDFAGLSIEQAREKVVEKLKADGLFVSEEEIDQNVGTSDRFGDVVEALPMTQWFVAVNKEIPGRGKTLKQLVQDATTIGHKGDPKQKINLIPENQHKRHIDRIENLHDWCISRQIWWGHRIPVWYSKQETRSNETNVYVGVSAPIDVENWEQDPDTLDTWFSSALWTFSTLGWPEKTNDLKTFHPSSWMQMGHEILFLWFQRMVMLSTYILDEIPFKDVYIHGILRDKDGKKFSKSSGNGINPLDIIAQYGTDALRWSVLGGITPGNDARFYLEKVEGAQHFVNKLWNMSRFMLLNISEPRKDIEQEKIEKYVKTLSDSWILERLEIVRTLVTENIGKYNFSYAGELLRDFTWNELADWYLEIAKVESASAEAAADKVSKETVLNYILNVVLKLWHPFMPFVTEAIWKEVYGEESILMVEKWPVRSKWMQRILEAHNIFDPSLSDVQKDFGILQNIIIKIRSLRADYKIDPVKRVSLILKEDKNYTFVLFERNLDIIKSLARLEDVVFGGAKPQGAIACVENGVEMYIDLQGVVDFEKEKERIEKEIAIVEPYLASLEKKLSNSQFVDNAPSQVVEQEQKKFREAKEKLEKLHSQLSNLVQ